MFIKLIKLCKQWLKSITKTTTLSKDTGKTKPQGIDATLTLRHPDRAFNLRVVKEEFYILVMGNAMRFKEGDIVQCFTKGDIIYFHRDSPILKMMVEEAPKYLRPLTDLEKAVYEDL